VFTSITFHIRESIGAKHTASLSEEKKKRDKATIFQCLESSCKLHKIENTACKSDVLIIKSYCIYH